MCEIVSVVYEYYDDNSYTIDSSQVKIKDDCIMGEEQLDYNNPNQILSDGRRMGDIMERWTKLMEVAEKLNPALYKQMVRGIFSPENDDGNIKIKLIEAIVKI